MATNVMVDHGVARAERQTGHSVVEELQRANQSLNIGETAGRHFEVGSSFGKQILTRHSHSHPGQA